MFSGLWHYCSLSCVHCYIWLFSPFREPSGTCLQKKKVECLLLVKISLNTRLRPYHCIRSTPCSKWTNMFLLYLPDILNRWKHTHTFGLLRNNLHNQTSPKQLLICLKECYVHGGEGDAQSWFWSLTCVLFKPGILVFVPFETFFRQNSRLPMLNQRKNDFG